MQRKFILLRENGIVLPHIFYVNGNKLLEVGGNSWVFFKYPIKELAVMCVPLCNLQSATDREKCLHGQKTMR